jgi:hypothetical protein
VNVCVLHLLIVKLLLYHSVVFVYLSDPGCGKWFSLRVCRDFVGVDIQGRKFRVGRAHALEVECMACFGYQAWQTLLVDFCCLE